MLQVLKEQVDDEEEEEEEKKEIQVPRQIRQNKKLNLDESRNAFSYLNSNGNQENLNDTDRGGNALEYSDN